MTSSLNVVLPESFGKPAAAREIVPGAHVNLFAVHDGHAQEAGTATLSKAKKYFVNELVQRFHNRYLPRNSGTDLVIIRSVTIANSFKNFTYSYTFIPIDGVPETIIEILSSVLYSMDSQAMLFVIPGSGLTEVEPSGSHNAGIKLFS